MLLKMVILMSIVEIDMDAKAFGLLARSNNQKSNAFSELGAGDETDGGI